MQFDIGLFMNDAVRATVIDASWKLKSLLRSVRFFSTRDMIMMFKSHILSVIEYRTPAIVHAATSTLTPLDRILTRFLEYIAMSDNEALLVFNLAPLAVRRDIAMLGVIHRAVLGCGPAQLRTFFQGGASPSRVGGRSWHHRHVSDPFSSYDRDYVNRSLVDYIWVYNLLPERIVCAASVKEFQSLCNELLKSRIMETSWKQTFTCRLSPRHAHPLW